MSVGQAHTIKISRKLRRELREYTYFPLFDCFFEFHKVRIESALITYKTLTILYDYIHRNLVQISILGSRPKQMQDMFSYLPQSKTTWFFWAVANASSICAGSNATGFSQKICFFAFAA